ncbi:MAG TPA: HypC/HybG/HupF family hydrogenase formation chaperone [Ktedonobacteraceae bacterium]|jgi:hydrogenase maturation factor
MNDCNAEHCLTCSDELVPATVLRVNAANGLALVERDGRLEEIDVTLVAPVAPGHILLVHAGIALLHAEKEEMV